MPELVITLGRILWQICTLRRGPQDLPASTALMLWMLVFNGVAGMLLERIEMPAASALRVALVDALVLIVLIKFLLHAIGKQSRFRQTVTAMAGTGLLLTFVAYPVVAWISEGVRQHRDVSVPMFFWLIVFGWNLLVIAHILRHAVGANLFVGFVLAVVFVFIDIQLINLVVPGPGSAL